MKNLARSDLNPTDISSLLKEKNSNIYYLDKFKEDKLRRKSYYALLLLIAFLSLIFIVALKKHAIDNLYKDWTTGFYTIVVTTFQLSRLFAAMLHKKSSNLIKEHENPLCLPDVTFVIPCKNEEKAIRRTVTKCFEVAYPKSKIEVIVINDGSTDRTIDILMELKKTMKDKNLIIIDWKQNKGKRHAMAEGIKRASGDIIIQLDSDSYIESESFYNLIRPFQNPSIGAVSAYTEPDNRDENWLTKMQTAYYFVSFRVLKAAESAFFTVFCCSGCCSAYRKDVILPIIDKWLNEKFLGSPITWGDDRALTNWVLRLDYCTIYSEDVKAYTIVPNTLKQFLKQQVRWKKGWFINSILASGFILKKRFFVATSYFIPLIFLTLCCPFVAFRALVYNPIFNHVMPTYYVLGVFLMAVIITTYYRAIDPKSKYWVYVFVWSLINMIFLSYILLYALLRLSDRRWGTR